MIFIEHSSGDSSASLHLSAGQHYKLLHEADALNEGLMPAGTLFGVIYYEPPAAANSAGKAGMQAFDENYYYLCFADNVWRRVALSEF